MNGGLNTPLASSLGGANFASSPPYTLIDHWPEMLRVHYRDGGKRFAPIVLKYHLRRLAAPLINWRRRRKFDR